MIYFSVTNNINIKLIDSTLVAYKRFEKDGLWINENIYCATYDEFNDIKKIFVNLKQEDFKFEIVDEKRFENSTLFPRKIGVNFKNEYKNSLHYETLIKEQNSVLNPEIDKKIEGYLEEQLTPFDSIDFLKNEIRLVIVGYSSNNLGEIINFCSAIRILHEKLKEKCTNLTLDIYLQASSNSYYKRDKEIFESYTFINKVMPLSITIQELSGYDYYIDTSSYEQSFYYKELPYIDFFLRHFGLNYEEIKDEKKHNELHLHKYHVNPKLQEKIEEIKNKGKLLLFHPYSAHITRSIPIENSKKILEKLIDFNQDYVVVTALKIENVKNDNFIDLSFYSKSFFDFVYIVSQMECVITVDTSTYHISDAFFIPTVALFTQEELIPKRLKYYSYVVPIKIKNQSKSFSNFIFKNEALNVDDFKSWNELKISKVIKLLEKIR
ncbi:MAG: hypothetical protein WC141_06190 [Arcobacteraceae bacterium]